MEERASLKRGKKIYGKAENLVAPLSSIKVTLGVLVTAVCSDGIVEESTHFRPLDVGPTAVNKQLNLFSLYWLPL